MRKANNLHSISAVSATGPLSDLSLAEFTRFGDFRLKAKNSAGTSPTLVVKLQQSPAKAAGYSYATVGETETKLKTGASTLVKHAITFTQSGARSIKDLAIMLKKIGTLAAGKKVTVEICSDNAGAPNTVLGTTTIDIDTEISTSFDYVPATFATTVDLADATVYHVVLSADYTASATNCVVARSKTLASGGNQQTFDGTNWTAVATESTEVYLNQFAFTDIAGGAFAQVTSVGDQTITLALESLTKHVRAYATIGGTSSPVFYTGLDLVVESRR